MIAIGKNCTNYIKFVNNTGDVALFKNGQLLTCSNVEKCDSKAFFRVNIKKKNTTT